MSDIWPGVERRSSLSDMRTSGCRMLNISEVRERSPTMSAELISADSEFPARAGHVVQRRTSVPPAVFPESVCDSPELAAKCSSGRAILGRGVSGAAAGSFDSVATTGHSDDHNAALSSVGRIYHESDVRIRTRIGRPTSPTVPTPHPLLHQHLHSNGSIGQVYHSALQHPVQTRWSSGDGRADHEGGGPGPIHGTTSYFGASNNVPWMSNSPLTSTALTYSTGSSWAGTNRPSQLAAAASRSVPKAQNNNPRQTEPMFLSHWRDGRNSLLAQNHAAIQRDLHVNPHIGQRQQVEHTGPFASGGITEQTDRRSVSADDARMLYQVALGSRDLIDGSVEPHMLRPLPAELFHRDSVVVIERPDLADIFKPPPQLSL